jgi:2-oxoglutarate ferredoxin oxidoreductase subunit alpha
MTETPLVIVVATAGPATGLPTRTEQGDLSLSFLPVTGISRAIFAPGSVEDCFT